MFYKMSHLGARFPLSPKSLWRLECPTKVFFLSVSPDEVVWLALALVEDGLTNPTWKQANNLSHNSGYEDYSFWYNAGSTVSGLEFNHVAVAAWGIGDGIDGSVSSTIQAGEIQSFTYEASLAGKSLIQDKSKLKVIAMLIDRNTGRIANASQTAINDYDPSVIHAVSTTSDNRDAGRCSLDGRRLNSPQRGINIIRMNDGTVKKVIVK